MRRLAGGTSPPPLQHPNAELVLVAPGRVGEALRATSTDPSAAGLVATLDYCPVPLTTIMGRLCTSPENETSQCPFVFGLYFLGKKTYADPWVPTGLCSRPWSRGVDFSSEG